MEAARGFAALVPATDLLGLPLQTSLAHFHIDHRPLRFEGMFRKCEILDLRADTMDRLSVMIIQLAGFPGRFDQVN